MRKALQVLAVMTVLLITSSAIILTDDSDACTGFYVGPDVSETGGTLIGQTADSSAYSPAKYRIVPASEIPGRTLVGTNGFVFELPDVTYRYYTSDIEHAGIEPMGCGNGVTNEMGVAYSGSITAYTSDAALAADPLVPTGLAEQLAGDIVGSCAKSAKEAVLLIASVIDDQGSSERNIYLFADGDEAWYMESYTGHQYAAVKLPKDKVAFFGNEFCLLYLEDFAGTEIITSPDFRKLADDNGFAVYDDGKLNLMKTYQRPLQDYGHMRTWMGHQKLAPSQFPEDYEVSTVYPFLFTPDEKVSVKDIADCLRNRFEGTEYCPDVTSTPTRVAGVENTSLAHILDVRSGLPKEMNTVRWSCIGPTVYGVFIPCSSGTLEINRDFAVAPYKYSLDDSTAYGLFKMLNALCTESKFQGDDTGISRDIISSGVREYWSDVEEYYIGVYESVLETAKGYYAESPQKAMEYLTSYTKGIQEDLMKEASTLYAESYLELMLKTTSRSSRTPISPFVEIGLVAERYGWTHTTSEDRMTFTNGDRTIVIEAPVGYSEIGKLISDGVEKKINVHVGDDGGYRIQYNEAKLFMTEGTASALDYSPVDSVPVSPDSENPAFKALMDSPLFKLIRILLEWADRLLVQSWMV